MGVTACMPFSKIDGALVHMVLNIGDYWGTDGFLAMHNNKCTIKANVETVPSATEIF